jgi:DNA polymerase III epsilon subunit family exonuclease
MPETAQTSQPAEDTASQRYGALCDRAVEFVLARNGAASEDLLIVHVFGNSGSPALWRPLLRSVMQADPRVTFRADGQWVLANQATNLAPSDLLLNEFVAIDVETTGLKPTQQRVIEIALIRYENGLETGRYESLIFPERTIPNFIVNLTSITNADVAEAPPFKQIADKVQEFIGDSLLVGHNVGFDISFVNAELKRCNLPTLINDRLDTLGMSVRLLRGLRKPNLQRVAEMVGLTPTKLHRAGVDAQLTAEVALRLVDEAVRQGVTSLDQLKGAARLETPIPHEDVGRARVTMDREMLAGIPRKPGVYLMRDAVDQVIYVGKSKNLRERVGSYYSQPIGYTRKMDGLLEAVKRIETIVVGSDIEAMLLESQLIHRYAPRYNTAMRSFEQYPYIKVDIGNPWPRITVSKQRKDDGARYFGPYQSSRGARRTVDVLNQILPLRTCTRSFKTPKSYGNPCIQLDLGRCAGPCTGLTDRDSYLAIVRDAVAFLDGQESGIYDRIWQELEKAAARLDFEKADRLRRDLRSVQGIVESHRRLRIAADRHHFLLVLPSGDESCRELFLILGGRIWKQTRIPRECDEAELKELVERLAASFERCLAAGQVDVTAYNTDEAHILNRWLSRNGDHPAVQVLDPASPIDFDAWSAMIRTALSFTDEELVFLDRDVATDPVVPEMEHEAISRAIVDTNHDAAP